MRNGLRWTDAEMFSWCMSL